MTVSEWCILAGIVLTIGASYAIPFAVWMAKMWSNLQLTTAALIEIGRRVDRIETHEGTIHGDLFEKISTGNDRANEHAERLSNHEVRITTNERELLAVRDQLHFPRGGGSR